MAAPDFRHKSKLQMNSTARIAAEGKPMSSPMAPSWNKAMNAILTLAIVWAMFLLGACSARADTVNEISTRPQPPSQSGDATFADRDILYYYAAEKTSGPATSGTWRFWKLRIDRLATLKSARARTYANALLGVACPPRHSRCQELLKRSIEAIQRPSFGEFGLGTDVVPVRLDVQMRPESAARLFHTLAFLQVADEMYRKLATQPGAPIDKALLERNLGRIFGDRVNGVQGAIDRIDRLQNARLFRDMASAPTAEKAASIAGVRPGYLPALLLLPTLTENFRRAVANERSANAKTIVRPAPDQAQGSLQTIIGRELQSRIGAGGARCDAIMVFVHGFSNTLDDAVRDAALVSEDTGFCGLTIAYVWRSLGTPAPFDCLVYGAPVGVVQSFFDRISETKDLLEADSAACRLPKDVVRRCSGNYLADLEIANGSDSQFDHFLRAIVAAKPSGTPVHVVAHSMGSQLVVNWLKRNPSLENQQPLASLTLIAPDVGTDEFRRIGARLHRFAKGVTVFGTERDEALGLSRCLRYGGYLGLNSMARSCRKGQYCEDPTKRLGLETPATDPRIGNVRFVDVSSLLNLGTWNHTYHQSNETMALAVRRILDGRLGGGSKESATALSADMQDEARLRDLMLPEKMTDFWRAALVRSDAQR